MLIAVIFLSQEAAKGCWMLYTKEDCTERIYFLFQYYILYDKYQLLAFSSVWKQLNVEKHNKTKKDVTDRLYFLFQNHRL